MAIYKCKMCGDTLSVENGQTVVTCESCGTTQTVHSFDNEKKTTFFKRANALRFKCEFDKAAGLYETLVSEFPNEAEAYWGLVLCKFGIEYVDDPRTGEKVPTCHRTQFASIFDDLDYKNAIKNADAVAEGVYKKEANEISKLQKGILEISSREDPFDIFICYKETDSSGNRTPDSVLAQDIYKELTNEGYRVFFSRITLEDKLGSQYEPYIFAALHSSKIMLHVTTSDEHSEAVWVRNEWSRYLSLIREGQKKILIPCYKNISPYSLPDEMQNLQGQDMGKLGSMQDLIRGVDKILGKNNKTIHTQTIATSNAISADQEAFESSLRKGYVYLSKKMWTDAEESFSNAIKLIEKCGRAYIGLMLAQSHEINIDSFLKNKGYEDEGLEKLDLARSFADEVCSKQLEEIDRKIESMIDKDSKNYFQGLLEKHLWNDAQRYLTKEQKQKSEFQELYLSYLYDYCVKSLDSICSINQLSYLEEIISSFKELQNYKDSNSKITLCNSIKEKLISNYIEQTINSFELPISKEISLKNFELVANKIIDNKKRFSLIHPIFEQIKEQYSSIQNDGYKYLEQKSYDLISSFSNLGECERLERILKSLQNDTLYSKVYESINSQYEYIENVEKSIKRKKRIKTFKISSIISACLAAFVAVGFGIKAIVDENERSSMYKNAVNCMENGDYNKAIEWYSQLGSYNGANKKIEVCNGLIELQKSIETKQENDAIKGIKTIINAGERVTANYSSSNGLNIKRKLMKSNDGADDYEEIISEIDFSLYIPAENPGYEFSHWNSKDLLYKNGMTFLYLNSNFATISYSINYDLDGGINSSFNPTKYTIETPTINLEPASKTNYQFKGWYDPSNKKIDKIEKGSIGDIFLRASFEINKYTVKFLNWDNEELYSTIVEHGSNVVYPFENPTRPRTQQYTYSFAGWDRSLNNIVSDTVIYARYSNTINQYTVTFKNYDGTIIGYDTVDYGARAGIDVIPTKPISSDDLHSYKFKSWDKDLSYITDNIETTAVFDEIDRYFITFKNYDGSILEKKRWDEGSVPSYSKTPSKPEDSEYFYVFENKWSPDISPVSGEAEYVAVYTPVKQEYTVNFYNYDGTTLLQTSKIKYGNYAQFNGSTPTRPKTQQYSYTFAGWDKNPNTTTIVSDTNFIAQYTSTINKYSITFYNYDGSLLSTTTVNYGENAVYKGAQPTKPSDKTGYKFKCWVTSINGATVDDLTNVTSNRSVYASYDFVTYQKIAFTKENMNYRRTAFLTEDNRLFLSGNNANSNLGFDGGWDTSKYSPTYNVDSYEVSIPNEKVIDVSVTGSCTILVTESGKAYSGGIAEYGLGREVNKNSMGSTAPFAQVNCYVSGVKFVKCFSSSYNSYLLDSNGKLYSCGINESTGLGQQSQYGGFVPYWNTYTFYPIDLSEKIVDVKTGGSNVAALTENGNIYYWGNNSSSVFGYNKLSALPRLLSDGTTKFKSIEIDGWSVYGVSVNNTLFISGRNHYMLANGESYDNLSDFRMTSVANVKKVVAGMDHIALVNSNGSVDMLGTNQNNQLGIGDKSWSIGSGVRYEALPGKNIAEVYCGYMETALLLGDGTVYVTGSESEYLLGTHNEYGTVKEFTLINYLG